MASRLDQPSEAVAHADRRCSSCRRSLSRCVLQDGRLTEGGPAASGPWLQSPGAPRRNTPQRRARGILAAHEKCRRGFAPVSTASVETEGASRQDCSLLRRDSRRLKGGTLVTFERFSDRVRRCPGPGPGTSPAARPPIHRTEHVPLGLIQEGEGIASSGTVIPERQVGQGPTQGPSSCPRQHPPSHRPSLPGRRRSSNSRWAPSSVPESGSHDI